MIKWIMSAYHECEAHFWERERERRVEKCALAERRTVTVVTQAHWSELISLENVQVWQKVFWWKEEEESMKRRRKTHETFTRSIGCEVLFFSSHFSQYTLIWANHWCWTSAIARSCDFVKRERERGFGCSLTTWLSYSYTCVQERLPYLSRAIEKNRCYCK